MCGRFTQKLTWSQIHDLYSLTASVVPLNLQPRYNGAPEQEFAACRLDNGGNRTMVQLRWGLVPSWARDVRIGTRLINARSETIHTKPSFGAAFRSRRCLVPAYGWFEWQRTGYGKQPHFLALEDGSPLSFAALWEHWGKGNNSLESFTIITTTASLEACRHSPSTARHHRSRPVRRLARPNVIRAETARTWCVNPMVALTRSVPLVPG